MTDAWMDPRCLLGAGSTCVRTSANGYSAISIAHAGEAWLSIPDVWFGCIWNAVGDTDRVLDGERLAPASRPLADPRCADAR